MKSEVVLMDFDGVIAQTFPLALAIAKVVNPGLTANDLRDEFKESIPPTLAQATTSPDKATRFWQFYASKVTTQPIVPAMPEAIERLAGAYALIIISGSHSHAITAYLTHYQLRDHFDDIRGSDDGHSKTTQIEQIVQQRRLRPAEAVFVTDTLGDIRQAKVANVGTIGVTWGYHSATTLAQGKPDTIIDDPDRLPGTIEEHFDFSDEYD